MVLWIPQILCCPCSPRIINWTFHKIAKPKRRVPSGYQSTIAPPLPSPRGRFVTFSALGRVTAPHRAPTKRDKAGRGTGAERYPVRISVPCRRLWRRNGPPEPSASSKGKFGLGIRCSVSVVYTTLSCFGFCCTR